MPGTRSHAHVYTIAKPLAENTHACMSRNVLWLPRMSVSMPVPVLVLFDRRLRLRFQQDSMRKCAHHRASAHGRAPNHNDKQGHMPKHGIASRETSAHALSNQPSSAFGLAYSHPQHDTQRLAPSAHPHTHPCPSDSRSASVSHNTHAPLRF